MTESSEKITLGDNNHAFQAGIISGGHFQNHFYPAPEQSKRIPKASLEIPFRRDKDFIERGPLLDNIRKRCAVPASRTALVGLGGVGKSQLAIEHCYRTAQESPDTWIFWVHGSNRVRLEYSYRDIAEQVKLESRHDSQVDIFRLVYDWLRNGTHGRWLLVLDNVDDAAVFTTRSSSGQSISSLDTFVPISEHGSVLITSRNRQVAYQFVEEYDVVDIKPMEDAHATALLRKKLGNEVGINDITELAKELEYMPLAIVQAGAYLKQRGARTSVQRYLRKLRKSDDQKTDLLNHEAGHLRRDREAINSITRTWQISFSFISDFRRSAADLLSLMSFFDRQGIPEALLRVPGQGTGQNDEDKENNYGSHSPIDHALEEFDEDILTLKNFSFLSAVTNATTFEMHALVQLATRNWLRDEGTLEEWKARFIFNLYNDFPDTQFEDWSKIKAYLPHVKSSLAQRPEGDRPLTMWAMILRITARFADQQGNATDAENLSRHARKAFSELFGETHPSTLDCRAIVGRALSVKGKHQEAEAILEDVVEIHKTARGLEHPTTLNSISALATLYWGHKQFHKAEKLDLEVLSIRTRLLGTDHEDTIRSMTDLAKIYSETKRLEDSKRLYRLVLSWTLKNYGLNSVYTLTNMDNLALVLWGQGEWKEAQELLLVASERLEQELGPDALDAIASKGYLAMTYGSEGRYKEAAELEVHVMEAKMKILGARNPNVIMAMSNVVNTWTHLGQFKDAEILLLQVIELQKQVLGPDHEDTLYRISKLADVLWIQGQWKSSEELELQYSEAMKRVFGLQHTLTWSAIALEKRQISQWRLVEEIQAQITLRWITLLGGKKHIEVLVGIGKMAIAMKEQNQYETAIAWWEIFLRLGGEMYGCMHADMFAFCNILGDWRTDISRHRKLKEVDLSLPGLRLWELGRYTTLANLMTGSGDSDQETRIPRDPREPIYQTQVVDTTVHVSTDLTEKFTNLSALD